MLCKLALRNVQRSLKDYLIYIMTVIMAFSLIFAFNFVSFSQEINELSSTMDNLKYAVIFVTLIILFVVAWLINYTTRFMFEKRSQEFGTYLILGIEKKYINRMFILENLILGIMAFLISFIIGIIFGNLFSAIIMTLFKMPYQVSLQINREPILLSIIYFILIYAFVLIRSSRRMQKMKIHDLLYLEKKNEAVIWKKKKYRNLLFILFVILGVIGLFLCDRFFLEMEPSSLLLLGGSIILLIISIYGITFTLSDFILAFINKRNKLKYRNDNLFVAKNYEAKSKTIGMTLGTLSLLITLNLVCMNMSFVMKDAYENNIEQQAPYDVIIGDIYSETDDGFFGINDNRQQAQKYIDYIHEHYKINQELDYQIYTTKDNQIAKYIEDIGPHGLFNYDCYLKESVYNQLVTMLGGQAISLDNEYLVTGDKTIADGLDNIAGNQADITINGQRLSFKAMTMEYFRLAWGTGNSFLIVVPDDVIEHMTVVNELYVLDTDEKLGEEDNDQLEQLGYYQFNDSGSTFQYYPVVVRGYYEAANYSAMTIFSFSLIYISFIFITVVGTILSIQTLSDSNKNKYQYQLLSKLGVSESNINKTILKQITANFIFPIIYPIIIALITAYSIDHLFYQITSASMNYLLTVLLVIVIFMIIYSVYYIATYLTFKNNVMD